MPGALVRPALGGQRRDALLAQISSDMPRELMALLAIADGVTSVHGHYGLLQLDGPVGIVAWNDDTAWKHAWQRRLDGFLCFGMTSVGDQFAFRRDEVSLGRSRVWQLDAFEMHGSPISESFGDFLERFLELSDRPDDLVALANEKLGPLPVGQLLAATPPAQFGLERLADRMRPMSARLVMVLNGDAYFESARCEGRRIRRLGTTIDEQGRPRLRFIAEGDADA